MTKEPEDLARKLQRESVEQHRYLYSKGPDGRWWFNRDGTVLTPVWVPCSGYEISLLEEAP